MTIRDLKHYTASLWDWGMLKGCFGDTKIAPTDVDGLVERKGHFLLLEGKGPDGKPTYGQDLTFKRLCETKLFWVLVMWGDPPTNPTAMRLWTNEAYGNKCVATGADVRNAATAWFKWADGNTVARLVS